MKKKEPLSHKEFKKHEGLILSFFVKLCVLSVFVVHSFIFKQVLKGCLNLVSNLYFETEDDFFSTDKVLATQQ